MLLSCSTEVTEAPVSDWPCRIGNLPSSWFSQTLAWPGPLPDRLLAWPDLSDLCGRLDPGGALPRVAGNYAAGAVRGLQPQRQDQSRALSFLHLAILIILGARLIPLDAPGLQAVIWRPLVKCGQQSLEVFCVGIYLSFIASLVLERISGGFVAQLLVGAGGLAMMTGVAYYRSWSKREEKSVHVSVHHRDLMYLPNDNRTALPFGNEPVPMRPV